MAVIARLFLQHRVEPKVEAGETPDMVIKRVGECVLDSGVNITFSMKHPERVQLVWSEKI